MRVFFYRSPELSVFYSRETKNARIKSEKQELFLHQTRTQDQLVVHVQVFPPSPTLPNYLAGRTFFSYSPR